MTYFIGNTLFEEYPACSIEECLAYLKSQSIIGVDIETGRKYPKGMYNEFIYSPGLDPYVSRIVMVQVGTLEKRFVIDARVVDCSFLKEIFEDEKILKVGHNLKFEGKHFLVNYKSLLVNVWDTMIAEKVLYNGITFSYSLKGLMDRYLGIKSVEDTDLFSEPVSEDDEVELDELSLLDYKEEPIQYVDKSIRLGFIEIGDNPFTKAQIEYGVNDIVAPLKIYEIQRQGRLVGEELYKPEIGFKLENKFTQVLAHLEVTGMGFDSLQWKNLALQNKEVYIRRLEKLNNYVESTCPRFASKVDLFTSKPACTIQWSSSKQVIEYFRYLEFCPKEKSKQTKRIEWTVRAKALFNLLSTENRDRFYANQETEIVDNESLILNYLLLKKAEQAYTTFGEDWLKYVHPITYRVHSSYNQYMYTSRMSSTNPNLQNIPSGKEYRSCFVSPKNTTWINCDFASQESRILADVSGVKTLIDFFVKGHSIFGDDMHSFAATNMQRVIRRDDSIVITKKSDPKARSIAKALNFALSYGASSTSLKHTLQVTEEEADAFIQAYFDGFPGLKEDFEKTKKEAVKRGWIELDSYTHKRYFFPQFSRMQELWKEAMSYYPEDYKTWPKEKKEDFKQELKILYPNIWKDYMILKGSLERKGLNYRIQGNAASMSKLSAILIYNNFKDNPNRSIVNIVHDEIIGETDIIDGQTYSKIISEAMIKAGSYICKNVPMGADAEVANYWKH